MRKNHDSVSRAIRGLSSQITDIRKRISQSMSDSGYANGKCRNLQKKLARLQKARQALRRV